MTAAPLSLRRLGSYFLIGLYKGVFCLFLMGATVDGGQAQEAGGEMAEQLAEAIHPTPHRCASHDPLRHLVTHRPAPPRASARTDDTDRANVSVAALFSRFNGLRPPPLI